MQATGASKHCQTDPRDGSSNVVKFREWYETTNHIWMVVELCTGDSLDAVLSQDKRLPVETVRQFGIEIAKALYYIHSLGILYCDLKPSRIMLDGAGVLKFSNFALARVEGLEKAGTCNTEIGRAHV